MQRKNYILTVLGLSIRNNSKGTQRPAFAMIMAVIVMIVVATIMAFTLNQTTQTAKRTADMYLYEQTELHAKSAIEYALFEIAEDGPCTTVAPFTIGAMYNVNITLKYVYKGLVCGDVDGDGTDEDYFSITTDEQNGSVLMDVTISVDAIDTGSEPITYFRRTIQKL